MDENKKAATASEILSHSLRVDTYYIKNLDQTICVRELSGEHSWVLVDLAKEGGFNPNTVIDVCFYCVCDEDGTRLFNNKDEKKKLAKLPWAALQEIFTFAMRISGSDPEGVEVEKKP